MTTVLLLWIVREFVTWVPRLDRWIDARYHLSQRWAR